MEFFCHRCTSTGFKNEKQLREKEIMSLQIIRVAQTQTSEVSESDSPNYDQRN